MFKTIKFREFLLRNTLLKNFSVLTTSTALSQFFAIFISITIARSLDPKLFGTYNLLHVQYAIFTVLASLGLKKIIIRDIARDKSRTSNIFFVSFILRSGGLLLAGIIFTVYYSFYVDYDIFLFALVIVSIIAAVFFDLFEAIAFGLEKMEYSGFIKLGGTVLFLLTLIILPNRMLTLQVIFFLFVLFFVLRSLIYYFLIKENINFHKIKLLKLDTSIINPFFKEAFPYYYLAILTLLSNQIPILFLQFRSGVEQIGFFNIANKVLMPINLVVTAALAAVYPNLAKLFVKNRKGFIKNVKIIFILLTVCSTFGALGINLFKAEIVNLLYGAQYDEAVLVLISQSWYVVVYAIVCLIGTILGAIDRQKILGYLSIACTAIQLPILWVGAKGGAQSLSTAFLIGTSLTLIVHFFVIHAYLIKKIFILFYFKILLIVFIGYSFSLLIPETLNLYYRTIIFISLLIAGGTYIFKKYRSKIIKIFNN